MEETPRTTGRVRLKKDQMEFLRQLLIEDRDQFFEDKRALDESGQSSLEILKTIRKLERILRSVEGAIWDLEAQKDG